MDNRALIQHTKTQLKMTQYTAKTEFCHTSKVHSTFCIYTALLALCL